MSGLAGVFNPSGAIDRDVVARMVDWIAYRGPDGIRSWHGTGVAMAFAKFARTPDAVFDRQPLCDLVSDTCVVFDGRLDNREELATQLDVRLSDDTCDVTLVAAAYRRWGTECAVRLLGDFSLAVWDGRQRRVFLARDVMGIRPLFYRELNGVWWWASDQRALLELDVPSINKGYVGEHLSGPIVSVDETIYKGIFRLPMAHSLVIGNGGARRWRYWRPVPETQPAYRDPRDYAHHYRALLSDAVRARLRMRGSAALLLSSGIDSSSVAAQIAELRQQGLDAAAAVRTFSMTVSGSPACEGPVIRQVLERLQLPSHMVPAGEPSEEEFASEAAASLDVPESPTSGMMRPLVDAVTASGRTIVFTGYGGDQWFDFSYGELSDLLRRGRLIAAARWLARVDRVPDQVPLAQVVRLATWMAVPSTGKGIVRRILRRSAVPWWVDGAFARAHRLEHRLRRAPDRVELATIAQEDRFRGAAGGDAAFRGDVEERFMAMRGLEYRHPLMDRRLIEFSMALPATLTCNRGVSKALMREAMLHDLPPSVTTTPSYDDFGFLGLRVLSNLGGRAHLCDTRPVRWGWVRGDAVGELYRGLERGSTRCLWPLSAMLAIDFWLRALEDTHRAQPVRAYGERTPHVSAC